MSKSNYFRNNKLVPSGLIHEAIISVFPELFRVMEIQVTDDSYLEYEVNAAYFDEQHNLAERYFRVTITNNKPIVTELHTQTRVYHV